MLVNIIKNFDTPGRRWLAGQNVDVDEAIARKWIADGYATRDTDGVQSPLIDPATGQPVGEGVAASSLTYHIIVGAGQSNMSGRAGSPDARLDPTVNQQVWTFDSVGTYANKIVPAQEPLGHFDTVAQSNSMGPLLTFANGYAALAGPGVRVLIVPCAYGGTAFTGADPNWDVTRAGIGGNYYARTLAQVTAAIAAVQAQGAAYKIGSLLWLQGENDVTNYSTSTTYYNNLSALIAALRANIPGANNAPFVMGRMAPDYVTLWKYFGQAIDVVHQAIPSLIANTAFASGLSGSTTGDSTHYNAAAQRDMGQKMLFAHLAALQNSSPSYALGAPTALALGLAAGTSQWLQWTAPAGAVPTKYTVYYRQTGTSTWLTANTYDSPMPFAVVTGLVASTSYDYMVAAAGPAGQVGPTSAIVTGSTGAASTVAGDNFTRADSTTTMGSTPTGALAWTPLSGTWGISGNQAYNVSGGGNEIVCIDSGKADCTISMTVGNGNNLQGGLVFRASDNNNLYFITNGYEIYRKQGGGFTSVSAGFPVNLAWAAGDVVTVVLKGPQIIIRRNGVTVVTYTDTFNQTATKHGLRSNGSTAFRAASFTVVG